MSEKVKRQSEFIITTGDGKEYRPLWKNPSKVIEYNLAIFEFPNLPGSKVDKGLPKGRKFPLELYFQGDDHLDMSSAFEISANDKRAWTVQHPLYGIIFGHPSDLLIENTPYNISKITGNLLETLQDKNPKTGINPIDKITGDQEVTATTFTESFANTVTPDAQDINAMKENTSSFYNEAKNSISNALDAEAYFNAFNEANSAINDATAFPLEAMQKIQTIINAPALFLDTVKTRITTLVNQFNRLRLTVSTLLRRSDKKIYEHSGGILVSTMALASVTNIDYKNRVDVLTAIDNLLGVYNTFIADLDTIQSDNAGSGESYIPDVDALIALNDLVSFTVSNLLAIAIDSKQERTVILEDDTNLVVLAHRFYGLQQDDSTIAAIIDANDIGLNELLQLRKGRKITYYV